MKKISILIVSLLCCAFQTTAQSTHLTIKVSNLGNNKGQVILDIFSTEDGFPMKTENAIKRVKVTIHNGTATFVVKDLPEKKYAFALMHDENGNNKLDVNWIGMPTEALGISNNAEGRFGPPSFQDASFILTSKKKIMNVKMKYL